jgi:hypothetical protein
MLGTWSRHKGKKTPMGDEEICHLATRDSVKLMKLRDGENRWGNWRVKRRRGRRKKNYIATVVARRQKQH